MADAQVHAISSAKRYGGEPSDYIDIHEFLDSCKAAVGNNAHRLFTHNSWFVGVVIPKCFGRRRQNSEGKWYNTKDIGEQHCLEDFKHKFIPTPQDYLEHFSIPLWVNNAIDVPNRLKRKKEEENDK